MGETSCWTRGFKANRIPGQPPACRPPLLSWCTPQKSLSTISLTPHYPETFSNSGRDSLLDKRSSSPPGLKPLIGQRFHAQPRATLARRSERKQKPKNKTPIQQRQRQKSEPRSIITKTQMPNYQCRNPINTRKVLSTI